MRKFTTYEFTFGKKKNLPLVMGFALLPFLGMAQTKEQVQQIRKGSNLSELSKIERNFKKNTLSVNQLKTLAKKRKIRFSGEVDNKKYQLVGFDKWTKAPLYYVTYNAGASLGTSTSRLNTDGGLFNLQGEGMIIHEWDGGGVLTSHREFGGRVTQKDNAPQVVDHSTHVAGTMIASGVDSEAKGMAPKAQLYAYEWTDDELEMIAAAKEGALVSNHSYGMISGFAYGNYSGNSGWHWFGSDEDTEFKGFGKYGETDREWDIISLNAPYYLPVRAAGNDRGGGPAPGETHYVMVEENGQTFWKESTKERQLNGGDDGFDVISSGSLGKNVLTVGAAQKIADGYKKPSDVVMASFSSFGPTDDGRIKPDITGIGVDIYSTNSTGDDSYTTMSGTSMAAPNVAGSLLLLQEHYSKLNENKFMRAATLKALAIATANEAGQSKGPDYASGWGLLNAYDAVTTISSKDKYSLIKEETLNNGDTNTINVVASGLEPLKVTIAWTDPVLIDFLMPNPNVLNDRKVTLVNDLDIRVLKDGETYFPWKLDPRNPGNAATTGDNTIDNVEQVVIESPEAGATYQIQVKHKNTLKKNEFTTVNNNTHITLVDTDSQDYSMVVTGINEGVDTDLALSKVEVEATPMEYTTTTPVKFYVENRGRETATGGKLKYELLNKDDNAVEHSGEVNIEDIEGNGTSTLEVNFDLSKSFVNYVIKGTVVIDEDEFEFNNTAETDAYGNVANLIPDDAAYNYSFENNPVKEGWSSQDRDNNRKSWAKYTDEGFAKTGEGFAINFPNTQSGTFNDWLFSNPILVKANTKYRLIYNVRKFQDIEEKIHVYYGDAPNYTAMVNDLGEKSVTLEGNATRSYDKYYYEFETTEDKVIYFGFNHAGRGSFAIGLDDITVERAEGEPIVEFKADEVVGTTFDVISFTSNVVTPDSDPVSGYQWEFTPNTVEFQDNTSVSSPNPKVIFKAEGTYSVKLKVTNNEGEGMYERAEYVTIANEATKANFAASSSNIYQGETVTFNNMSTGNPEPTEFEWTVTPSEGVELLTGSTETNLVAKFNNSGIYTVALKAKSVNNEDTYTAENVVTVQALRPAVQNLTNSLDTDTNGLQLNWEEPVKLPIYIENFESVATTGGVPADMKDYDGNGDGASWFPTDSGYQGTPAIFSLSWYFEFFSADDWFVTPKLRAGAEVLKFMVQNTNPARYDVYIVPVPASGEHPTLEEIKETGVKVYENDLDGASDDFVQRTVDLSGKTSQDFFLAFNHRTKAEDEGLLLVVDNIMVGYNDSPYSVDSDSKVKVGDNLGQLKTYAKSKGDVLVDFNLNKYKQKDKKDIKINFGVTDFPILTGYRVEKDGTTVESIEGKDNTAYAETLDAKGTYTYNVYAVYSDGESDPVTVTVDANSLATSEVEVGKELQVYPNPSNGMFVVMNESGVTSFTTEVYNMAGQVIYQNKFKGNKAELNLTKYPSGVYILKVVDNNGGQQSVKVVIK